MGEKNVRNRVYSKSSTKGNKLSGSEGKLRTGENRGGKGNQPKATGGKLG